MKFTNFFLKSVALFLICVAGWWIYFWLSGHWEARLPVTAGLLIAYGNALLGFGLVSWGYRRSQKDFFISVYGGMIFRILLIFFLLFILIKAFQFELFTLLSSLLIAYFLFLGLEIFEIHKQSGIKGI